MSKWSAKSEEKFKISKESAEASTREFSEYYRVDIDEFEDKTQKASMEFVLNKLQKAYMRGDIENARDAGGRLLIIQHINSGKEKVTYDPLGAKHKRAMDGIPLENIAERQHALLGSLCGLGSAALLKFDSHDLSNAECLATIFFAS